MPPIQLHRLTIGLLKSAVMSELHPITQIQLMTGGYYLARSLQVVADLGIADRIAESPVSAAELAQETGSSADALGRVLSLLCAHGVFARTDAGFVHSEVSQFLRSDHPMSMGAFARMFGIPVILEATLRLDETLATGKAMGDIVAPGGFWSYLQQHPKSNKVFNATMAAKSAAIVPLVPAAYDFAPYARIADIAGGRGHLLQAILKAFPAAHGILFDQPHVIEEVAGIASDGLTLQAGSFFSDSLPRADAYVLMEIIHDWDDEHSEKILKAVRQASPAGAKVLLVEAMMPETPTPCWTSTLDVVMLNLLGGRQRSFAEYAALLERSGFRGAREIPIGADYSIIEASGG